MRSILIVEDEAIVALDLRDQLESRGFVVAGLLGDAGKVVDAVRTQRPNVVLMDIKLSRGADGIALAEELFVCEDTPVVFLSAFSDRDILARAARTGAYGFLTKPVTPAALASTLELAVEKHAVLEALNDETHWLGVADVPAVWLTSEGTVVRMNRPAVRLTGYVPVETELGPERPGWVRQLVDVPVTRHCLFQSGLKLNVRSASAPIDVSVTKYRLENGGSLCFLHSA